MAYNYIELVNSVNRKLNEVELTTAAFPSADGFYRVAKDSINSSLRDINQTHYQWPFNHDTVTDTMVVGTGRYNFPADAATIDMDSFRVKTNATFGNVTQRLEVITYDTYLQNFVDQEYTTDTSIRDVPRMVCKAPSLEYIVTPLPDQAYEVVFEYFKTPTDLVNATDVPTVPERFKQVILDGAMYHAYMFRSNEQAANISKSKFEEGLKRMRTLLINNYEYMSSTYLPSRSFNVVGLRVK